MNQTAVARRGTMSGDADMRVVIDITVLLKSVKGVAAAAHTYFRFVSYIQ